MTAADLAAIFDVPVGTIYAWASLDHWRRTGTLPKRYDIADAMASYEHRRVTTPSPAPKISIVK